MQSPYVVSWIPWSTSVVPIMQLPIQSAMLFTSTIPPDYTYELIGYSLGPYILAAPLRTR